MVYPTADTAATAPGLNPPAAHQVLAVPLGTIVCTILTTAPTGWLLADGSVHQASAYPALAAALGAVGPTFQLPDFRCRTVIGASAAGVGPLTGQPLLAVGGSQSVTLSQAHIPQHSHTFQHVRWIGGAGLRDGGGHGQVGFSGGGSQDTTSSWGQALPQPVDLLPPFVAVNFIIKA